MFVKRADDGIWIQAMPFWVVDTLMRLPDWLASDDERVRKRLLPDAHEEDCEENEEWRRHAVPELEHLFSSRAEIVHKDLQGLQLDSAEGEPVPLEEEMNIDATFSLFIDSKHVSAWTTSLQAATHTIYILEELTEEEIGGDPLEEPDASKQVALLRMAALQELLVQMVE